MSKTTEDKSLYETRLVLYRLIKAFEGDENLEGYQKTRIEQAKMILAKYGDIENALRQETVIKPMQP